MESKQATTATRPVLTGMLLTNAKQGVPSIVHTQAHHRKASKGTVCNDRTVRFFQMRRESLE
ncbi:MAG: hypothetical protein JO125_10475 [Chloroflexi bacterium]|nr:hypothetical protein [Ktedonobacteraceae bacterium]MBV8821720.1 hypothetical protein [Ktedonobacteraceae bacterium]MBV9021929.1 hypothetical protein [Ktedonobacteraceae bacterium]MBV9707818.1 hypothetical protein [Chloroflexota bacterium]